MPRKKKLINTRPCQGCGKAVVIQSDARFVRMVRKGLYPRCKDCRRLLRAGSCTEQKFDNTKKDPALGLSRKYGRQAKDRRRIEGMKVDIVGGPGDPDDEG
jgi:ssDNA-binding Zn-finger/Zn-ribbon topoisomerase 1